MFELDTPEQASFRESVRKLTSKEVPKYVTEKKFPRKLFSILAQNGLTGVNIDEAYGGISVDAFTRALIIEELASIDLGPAIFISVHNMVAGIVNSFGSPQQKEKYLPGLASGKLLGAFALSEPGAGSDAAALKTHAEKGKNSYTLNGSKCWITSAGEADVYVVFAKTAQDAPTKSISAFIVENTQQGLTVGPHEQKMGCELSPIASLYFDNAQIPEENLLGSFNDGYRIALSGLAGGRVNIGAAANGLSRTAIEKAMIHLLERKQFDQPLIDFQGLQFMLADMKIKHEAAQLLTWRAAQTMDISGDLSVSKKTYPSISKCFATDTAMQITTDAVQLMGASGYMKETGIEKLMRDAKMLQIVEGTNQIQRVIIARELRRQHESTGA